MFAVNGLLFGDEVRVRDRRPEAGNASHPTERGRTLMRADSAVSAWPMSVSTALGESGFRPLCTYWKRRLQRPSDLVQCLVKLY